MNDLWDNSASHQGQGSGSKSLPKTRMVCLECGRKFWKVIRATTLEVKCPKCGGYDTEVD